MGLGKIGKSLGKFAKKAVGALANPMKMLSKLGGGGLLKGLLGGALGLGGMMAGAKLASGFLKGFLGGGGCGQGLQQGCCAAAQQRGLSNISMTSVNVRY